MTGYEILQREIGSWGQERSLFVVNRSEILILVAHGACVVVRDQDNGDGTFLSTVTFGEKTFSASSKEKVF